MNHYPCGRGWHLKEDPSYSVSNPFFEACNYFDAMKRRLGVKHRRLERGQSFPNFTVRGQPVKGAPSRQYSFLLFPPKY